MYDYVVQKVVLWSAMFFSVAALLFCGCADADMGNFNWEMLSFADSPEAGAGGVPPIDASGTEITGDTPSSQPDTKIASFDEVMGLLPSVVMIEALIAPPAMPEDETHREYYETPHSDPTQPMPVYGAGIIIDEAGNILTTAHLVEGADDIMVLTFDGMEYPARITGTYDLMDIAVLSISGGESAGTAFIPAVIGDPSEISPGDWIGIVGNPFGLGTSLTVGVVGAVHRRDINPRVIGEYIQVDAAVNPGFSGGPLVNLDGEVVGMVSGLFSPAEGIGFAIPIDEAMEKAGEIVATGHVATGWIGVTVQELTPELSRIFQVPGDTGVLVVSVEKQGPGDWAGILSGDVIIKFGRTDITNGGDYDTAVMTARPGMSYNVELLRGGQPLTVVVAVSEKYTMFAPETADVMDAGTDLLGLFVVDVPEDVSTATGISEGVLVFDVTGDVSEINPGDLILSVDRRIVTDRTTYLAALAGAVGNESALLLIYRQPDTFFVTREIRK